MIWIETGEVANLAIRIEEEVSSNYSELGRINTTATGRIVVHNPLNRTLANVQLKLNSTAATDLPIGNKIVVPSLPPNESVVAIYNITAPPRLVLSHDWRSLTYQEAIGEFLQGSTPSSEALDVALDPRRLLDGVDNLLEFTITVGNNWGRDISNVTLADLLPAQVVNSSFVAASTSSTDSDPYGGALAYDSASDSLVIPLLRNNTNTTLTFQATLPASAFTDSGVDSVDMRHAVRAGYVLSQEFAQEPLTLEQSLQVQAGQLSSLASKQEQAVRDSDPFELLDFATTLEQVQALPQQLSTEAFATARELGIPVDNETFAEELENQTRARVREAMKPLDDALNFSRVRFERFIDNYGQMAALTFQSNRTLQSITGALNVTINESDRREALQNLSESGFPPEIVEVLRNESLNDTQIEELRQFLLNNSETLANTSLEDSFRQLQKTYISAAGEWINMSTQALANRVVLAENHNVRGNLSAGEVNKLHAVRVALNASIQSKNWTGMRDLGKELMDLSWAFTLRTGDVLFAGTYWKAARFHLAGMVGEAGDNASAEALIAGLEPESHIYGYLRRVY